MFLFIHYYNMLRLLRRLNMKVSFIGLGVMGYPMAGYLSNKNNNLKVKVYNRTTEKAKKWLNEYNGFLTCHPK